MIVHITIEPEEPGGASGSFHIEMRELPELGDLIEIGGMDYEVVGEVLREDKTILVRRLRR